MYKTENQIKFDDFVFPYGTLNKDNRWVKMGNEIPWGKIEEIYAKKFGKNGNRAKNIRIALGSLIIKQTLNCSDIETVNQVAENPYLQYFIGMKEYCEKAPFSQQSLSDFRKRFSEDDILDIVNDMIIDEEKPDESEDNDKPNSGTLAIDATCAPADIAQFSIADPVCSQQLEMYIEQKHSVTDRIVSISQPHVRPIPRGKAKAKTEFGAKVKISIKDGFARIETLSFDAYNEGKNLIEIIERYKNRYGFYPERVLVDKLYRNRENLMFCKEKGVKITGPALGRPKKNAIVDKKSEYQDICDRNCVEGKFGEGKTTFGLDRISARLKSTSECVIKMCFLVMNLNKRLRNLLCRFWDLIALLFNSQN